MIPFFEPVGEGYQRLWYREFAGVTEPEQKRKIIGKLFIDVFDEEAHKVGGAEFLAQGTLYPDVIESVSFTGGPSVTIRMHQERAYPGRVSGTDLVNPDFVALAIAYGAHGELVEKTADFAPAFERAARAGKPALIEIRLSAEVITPRQTLSQIRAAALASRSRP